jgi:hypothetical protein
MSGLQMPTEPGSKSAVAVKNLRSLLQWNPSPVTKFIIVMCWIGLFVFAAGRIQTANAVVPFLLSFTLGATILVAWALGYWRTGENPS